MDEKMQLTNFNIMTSEDAYGLPRIKLDAEFTVHSAPGKQIVFMNSALIKSILGQVVKQAVQLDDVQLPKIPMPQEAQSQKEAPSKNGGQNEKN